jgi:acyl-CoA synthetase (NDP forming)
MVLLSFNQAKSLLDKYRIGLVESLLVKDEKGLERVLKEKKLRFPLALKIQSPDIIHKTDIGGVMLGINSLEEALKAFRQVKSNARKKAKKARIQGVLVQEMKQGKEVIIGGKIDETFGPIVLFGLGGILVELLRDTSIRVCPINKNDAMEMVREIKGYRLLKGFRGEKAVNFKALEDLLLKAGNLMMHEKIKELDLNPVMADEKNAWVVDARIIR